MKEKIRIISFGQISESLTSKSILELSTKPVWINVIGTFWRDMKGELQRIVWLGASLGKLEKFQHRSALPNIKYKCAVSVKPWQMSDSSDVPAGCVIDFYRPQRSWGKVMFLQVSVILLTGGGSTWPGTPSGTRYPPRDQVHPPQTRYTPPDQVHPPLPRPGTPPRHRACWEIRSTRGRYASYWNALLYYTGSRLTETESEVFQEHN